MSTISKIVIPVLVDGQKVNQEYDLPAGGSGGLPTDISNPQNGQILRYDSTLGAWVNGGIASVSGTTLTIG